MEASRPMRGVPLGLLGMVAIVVAVESYVARHAIDFTETSRYSWTLSDAAARREAISARVLCFGDSLVKHGLLPEMIEDRLGKSVYNLAICAAPAPAQYHLLRHALDAGARPEAIVVDFMPGLLAGGLDFGEKYWAELLSPAEIVELARSARDARFLMGTMLDRALPTLRGRWEIRNKIVAAVKGETDPLRGTNLTHTRNWGIHRGAEYSQDNLAFNGEPTEEDHVRVLSDRFWCHRINRLYLDRFLRLAESRGVRVYWLLPPASPKIQQRRVESGADAKYTRFVREIASQHPGLVVLDARRSGYDHTRFVDPIHLTGKGGLALSAEVADAIVARREAWVDLPPYRDHPLAMPLEDVEQSRMAVMSGNDRARR
jgi:hypothetical protein